MGPTIMMRVIGTLTLTLLFAAAAMGFPEPTPNEIVPEIEMAQGWDMSAMLKPMAKKLLCQFRAGIEYSEEPNTSPAVKQAVGDAKKILDSVASDDAKFKALLDCATGAQAIAACVVLVDAHMAQSLMANQKVMGALGDLKSDFEKITTEGGAAFVAKAKACAPPSE